MIRRAVRPLAAAVLGPALGPVLGLALGLVLAAPGGARAQMDSREGIALQNQILELRRDLQVLREQMGRGGTPSYAPVPSFPRGGGGNGGEMLAQLLDRVANLEEQVRRIHGRQDELANRVQRLGEDLTKQVGDLTFRLQALESGGRPAMAPPGGPGTAPPPPAPGPGVRPGPQGTAPPGPPGRTPELAMQEGHAALARRDYAKAEAAAREVLAMRATPRMTEANFLLAQALAGKRDFGGAAVAYDDTFNRARTGPLAPDALLGLAGALLALNERNDACTTLNRLRQMFPQARAQIQEQASALRQRAQCR